MAAELVLRFLIGGAFVSLFAVIAECIQPKSFAGLFGAAPSIALAGLILTVIMKDAATAATEAHFMVHGSLALVAYSLACGKIVTKPSVPAWLSAGLLWISMDFYRTVSLRGRAMKIKLSAGGIKQSHISEWLLRFGFGGAISVLASLIAKYWGPEIGGLFLAFPSILPATLTLIVHDRNRKEAAEDAYGASLGAVSSACFAGLVFLTLQEWGAAGSLSLATVVWLVLSAALWWIVQW